MKEFVSFNGIRAWAADKEDHSGEFYVDANSSGELVTHRLYIKKDTIVSISEYVCNVILSQHKGDIKFTLSFTNINDRYKKADVAIITTELEEVYLVLRDRLYDKSIKDLL